MPLLNFNLKLCVYSKLRKLPPTPLCKPNLKLIISLESEKLFEHFKKIAGLLRFGFFVLCLRPPKLQKSQMQIDQQYLSRVWSYFWY